MHKYQPRVHIIKKPDQWDGTCDKLIASHKYTRSFTFPETVFIAVTAYQNQLVGRLFRVFSFMVLKLVPNLLEQYPGAYKDLKKLQKISNFNNRIRFHLSFPNNFLLDFKNEVRYLFLTFPHQQLFSSYALLKS